MVAVNRFNISAVGKMIANFLFSDLITTFIFYSTTTLTISPSALSISINLPITPLSTIEIT
jgi:hypothetical protein